MTIIIADATFRVKKYFVTRLLPLQLKLSFTNVELHLFFEADFNQFVFYHNSFSRFGPNPFFQSSFPYRDTFPDFIDYTIMLENE